MISNISATVKWQYFLCNIFFLELTTNPGIAAKDDNPYFTLGGYKWIKTNSIPKSWLEKGRLPHIPWSASGTSMK